MKRQMLVFPFKLHPLWALHSEPQPLVSKRGKMLSSKYLETIVVFLTKRSRSDFGPSPKQKRKTVRMDQLATYRPKHLAPHPHHHHQHHHHHHHHHLRISRVLPSTPNPKPPQLHRQGRRFVACDTSWPGRDQGPSGRREHAFKGCHLLSPKGLQVKSMPDRT